MKWVNLTPHDITVFPYREDTPEYEKKGFTIPASGQIARVNEVTETIATTGFCRDGEGNIWLLPVQRKQLGNTITNLPETKDGVNYIVSYLVLQAVSPFRQDVYAPGELVRDAGGNIVGCKSLQCR